MAFYFLKACFIVIIVVLTVVVKHTLITILAGFSLTIQALSLYLNILFIMCVMLLKY